MIPQKTIDELVLLRTRAKLATENFTDAVADQAEKHKVDKGALRKYVCAVEADKVGKLDAELEAIAALINRTSTPSTLDDSE